MPNSEATLSIVLSLIDSATAQLQDAQGAFAKLGVSANEAAGQITGSMSAAEEAVVKDAQATANAWQTGIDDTQGAFAKLGTSADEAAGQITSSLSAAEESVVKDAQATAEAWQTSIDDTQQLLADRAAAMAGIGEVMGTNLAEGFAQTVIPSFEASVASLNADMATAGTEAGAVFGESAGKSAGDGFGNYFKTMILAYMGQQVGQTLSTPLAAAIAAAAGNPLQIQQLQDQIKQQHAHIGTHQSDLLLSVGTIQQVAAKHQLDTADISAETNKIAELQKLLAPLIAAQKIAGDSQKKYAEATLQLTADWQAFLATAGTPALNNTTAMDKAFDGVVKQMTAFAQAHPLVTTGLLDISGAIGGIISLASSFLMFVTVARFGLEALGMSMEAGLVPALWAMAVAIALNPLTWLIIAVVAAVAAMVFFAYEVYTNWDMIKGYFHEALNFISNIWNATWTAISGFFTGWLKGIGTAIQSGLSFIKGLFSDLLNFAESVTSKVLAPIQAIAGIMGSVGGAIGGSISSAFSAITHVQDAIITPNGIVQTDPADYLIATKTPGALAGGGGGVINVYIQGGTYLDQGGATMIGNALARQIGLQLKLRNYY